MSATIELQQPASDMPGTPPLWDDRQNFYTNWCSLTLYRRHTDAPNPSAPWQGAEKLQDQHGRIWKRFFSAVVDDFGNLVEVPA